MVYCCRRVAAMAGLPLFPLKTVLYPGAALPLHVFEERYKLMIEHCVDGDSTFGVVLIKSGSEVGEPAEPYEVGTRARIIEVARLDDGRLNILTRGEERFRVTRMIQLRPYLKAEVETFADQVGEYAPGDALVGRVTGLYAVYVRLLLALSGQWQRSVPLARSPEEMSFSVAHALRVDLSLKQALLEDPSPRSRLVSGEALLEKEIRQLRRAVRQRWFSPGGTGFPVPSAV